MGSPLQTVALCVRPETSYIISYGSMLESTINSIKRYERVEIYN